LVQVATEEHPPLTVAHSFTSTQLTTSPEYPLLQVQKNDPTVLVQVASGEQLPLLDKHSLTSEQPTPAATPSPK
jgi:hypothetical protein